MKVIIDTNIIVDAIYEHINNCVRILELAGKGVITPVTSQGVEMEYNLLAGKNLLKGLKEDCTKGNLKPEDFDKAQEYLYRYHEMINGFVLKNAIKFPVKTNMYISPDKDDNKLINLAVDSNSSYILTKNVAHFRCVEQQGVVNKIGVPIKIMTPKQFNQYYMEHKADIEKETERVSIVEKYIGEFKQAKHWSYEDAKSIDNINSHFGKFLSIEQLRYFSSHYFTEVNKLKDEINKITSLSESLKEASGWLSKYEINKNTVEGYESTKILKPVSKADYEFAKNEMSVAKGFLTQLGIKDRDDYNSKLLRNDQDKLKLSGLESELGKCKGLHSMFSKAMGVINKAIDKDMDAAKDLTKSMIKDMSIDR